MYTEEIHILTVLWLRKYVFQHPHKLLTTEKLNLMNA